MATLTPGTTTTTLPYDDTGLIAAIEALRLQISTSNAVTASAISQLKDVIERAFMSNVMIGPSTSVTVSGSAALTAKLQELGDKVFNVQPATDFVSGFEADQQWKISYRSAQATTGQLSITDAIISGSIGQEYWNILSAINAEKVAGSVRKQEDKLDARGLGGVVAAKHSAVSVGIGAVLGQKYPFDHTPTGE